MVSAALQWDAWSWRERAHACCKYARLLRLKLNQGMKVNAKAKTRKLLALISFLGFLASHGSDSNGIDW